MKVALFGGAFDPPHLGHQRIAQEMVQHHLVDEVWFVPVFTHPWAERLDKLQLAPYQQRLEMLRLILTPQTQVTECQQVSFTYSTLQYFAHQFPQHQFSWVIGADNLAQFHEWDHYQQIIDEFGVYVYPRVRFSLQTQLAGLKLLHDFPEIRVSSTEIKSLLCKGKSISDLVNLPVATYIKTNNLYQS